MNPRIFFSVWIPLAFRFITHHKRKTLATGSFILLGTAILVLLYSITTGINDAMINNTTSLHYGHIFVELPVGDNPGEIADKLSKNSMVKAALPRYRFRAVLKKGSTLVPSVLYAIDPKTESKTTAISKRITKGSYPSDNGNNILTGSTAAGELNIKPGENLSVIDLSGRPLGSYAVSGLFKTGTDNFDRGISFMSAKTLSDKILKTSKPEISIFIKPGINTDDALKELTGLLPPNIQLRTWEELMPDLVQLIKMNEVSAGILMTLVFILVGFGIANNYILTIVERFKEFGILKAMGMTANGLVWLVFLESFLLCLTATLAGLLTGWLAAYITACYGIDLSTFTSHNRYFIADSMVYPRITFQGLYLPFLISVIVSIVSSYLPARIAAKKMTVDALRYE